MGAFCAVSANGPKRVPARSYKSEDVPDLVHYPPYILDVQRIYLNTLRVSSLTWSSLLQFTDCSATFNRSTLVVNCENFFCATRGPKLIGLGHSSNQRYCGNNNECVKEILSSLTAQDCRAPGLHQHSPPFWRSCFSCCTVVCICEPLTAHLVAPAIFSLVKSYTWLKPVFILLVSKRARMRAKTSIT